MKQSILILLAVVLTISLTSFGYMKWKDIEQDIGTNPETTSINVPFDFVYSVETRFMNTVTKEKIDQATSVIDIISSESSEKITSYHDIQLSTFAEHRKDWVKARGKDEVFNDEQIEILRSLNYGSSFSITGNIKKNNEEGGSLAVDTFISYMTVVPNTPGFYKEGKDALISYLKENSEAAIAIAQKDKLQPGKISFFVTRDGAIDQVKLTYTSGYTSIDEKMMQLIQAIPGSWEVATNAKGEKVGQELVFFFGLIGC